MKNILLFLLFAGICAAASADVTIVNKVHMGKMMNKPEHDTTNTIMVKGDKGKIISGDVDTYQIFDLKTGNVSIVDPKRKTVMVMSAETMRNAAGMLGGMMGSNNPDAKPAVEKLGTSHSYAGYDCTDYKITTTGVMTMSSVSCLTSKIDIKEFDAFKQYSKLFGIDFTEEGFPVHSETTISIMGQTTTATSELVKASHDSIAASEFVVPADYKVQEMKMPQIPKQ